MQKEEIGEAVKEVKGRGEKGQNGKPVKGRRVGVGWRYYMGGGVLWFCTSSVDTR